MKRPLFKAIIGPVSNECIIEWLESNYTDMEEYDPRDEMEEGERPFGALARSRHKENQNLIISEISKRLGISIRDTKYYKTLKRLTE